MKLKVQNIDVHYSINPKGVKELVFLYKNFVRMNMSVITEKNDIFRDQMRIHYKSSDITKFESVSNGTIYHIFRSEFRKVLEKCIIVKGIVQDCDWAIRSHGGLYSLTYVP